MLIDQEACHVLILSEQNPLNGSVTEILPDETILQAALRNRIHIPALCTIPALVKCESPPRDCFLFISAAKEASIPIVNQDRPVYFFYFPASGSGAKKLSKR